MAPTRKAAKAVHRPTASKAASSRSLFMGISVPL
jgi:hypothetical protein